MQFRPFSNLRFYVLFFLCQFMLFSCQQYNKQDCLERGLDGYLKKRKVYQQFIPTYTVEEIAVFEASKSSEFVLKLGKNTTKEIVGRYTLGVRVYTEKNTSENKFLIWDTNPELIEVQQNKYITSEFKMPLKKIDSVIFFLYDRKGYTSVIGRRIILKNLKM